MALRPGNDVDWRYGRPIAQRRGGLATHDIRPQSRTRAHGSGTATLVGGAA